MRKEKLFFGICFFAFMCFSSSANAAQDTTLYDYNILDFGADGTDLSSDRVPMNQALAQYQDTDGDGIVTVYVPGGTYYIDGALHIHSNTRLLLADDAVIKRVDSSQIPSSVMLMNVFDDKDGDYSNDVFSESTMGGYSLSQNISIQGGTWDGNGSNDTISHNLITISHCSGASIENVKFENCYGGHAIEYGSVENAVVRNCSFSNFYGNVSGDILENQETEATAPSEAIQLDICHYDPEADEMWNGYFCDDTICKNITIEGNHFDGFPRGVGNHHALPSGEKSLGVIIINNTFSYTGSNVTQQAVYLYGFSNSFVSKNIISGYAMGIQISNSDGIQVEENDISSSSLNGINVSSSTGVSILGNSLNNIGRIGINVFDNASCTELSANTVSYSGINITASEENSESLGAGFVVSSSNISNCSGNKISNANGYGIVITKSNISTLQNSTISDSVSDGIMIATDSLLYNLKNNTILRSQKNGITVCGNSEITNSLYKNTLANNVKFAISILGSETYVKSVSTNTIDSSEQGIVFNEISDAKNIYNNKVQNISGNGISICAGSKIDNVYKNTVTACNGIGILVTGVDSKVMNLGYTNTSGNIGNTLNNITGYGICINNGAYVEYLKYNLLSAIKSDGVYVGNSSKIYQLRENTLSDISANGITISNGELTGSLFKNNLSTIGKNGISILGSASEIKSISTNVVEKVTGMGIIVNTKSHVENIYANTISDITGHGIALAGGSDIAKVYRNVISSCQKNGISVSGAGTSVKNLGYTSAGTNYGNTIKNSTDYGICISGGCNIYYLKYNDISNIGKDGIYVGTSTEIYQLRENQINAAGANGIKISDSAITSSLYKNTINSPGSNGIFVTGTKSKLKSISTNNIQNSIGAGVLVNESAFVSNIYNNSIKDAKNNGMTILSRAVVERIYKNNIENPLSMGISISGEETKVTDLGYTNTSGNIGNTITNAGTYGICIYSSAHTKYVRYNNLSQIGKDAIYLGSGASAYQIRENTIKNAKEKGITISNGIVANTVYKNEITDGCNVGILITGTNTEVLNISTNTIGQTLRQGICVNNGANIGNAIKANKISAPGSHGIYIAGSANSLCSVKDISKNAITDSKDHALYLNFVKISTVNGNSMKNSAKSGIVITGVDSSVDSVTQNTIEKAKSNGMYILNKDLVKTIEKNTITDCGGKDIYYAN